MHRLVVVAVLALASACVLPVTGAAPSAPSAPAAAAAADTLARVRAALPGPADGEAEVVGSVLGTIYPLDVVAGECVEVAATVEQGVGVSLAPLSETTRWYGHEDGATALEVLTHSVCVDVDGRVHLQLTSSPPAGQGPLAQVRFVLAWRRRPEAPEVAEARRRADRARLVARAEATCARAASPAEFHACRDQAALDLAARDARAAASVSRS
ncbi:MAG: hypothetical protein IPL61_39725 [Myxococcales bacterium]|nr:hypothetical protein [Myxococcales bacterium]